MNANANARANDLIVITTRLADVLREENEALRNRASDAIEALLEKKLTLCRAYEARARGLAESADELKTADVVVRESLRRAGADLDALTEENARLLKVAVEVGRRVLATVAEAVRISNPGPGTYTAGGMVGAAGAGAAPRNVAISFDQSL